LKGDGNLKVSGLGQDAIVAFEGLPLEVKPTIKIKKLPGIVDEVNPYVATIKSREKLLKK